MALRLSAWLLFKSPLISLFRLLSGLADKGHTCPSCCFEFRKRLCKIQFKCEFELNWSQHTESWIGIIQRCRRCILGNGVIFHLFSVLLYTKSDCSFASCMLLESAIRRSQFSYSAGNSLLWQTVKLKVDGPSFDHLLLSWSLRSSLLSAVV